MKKISDINSFIIYYGEINSVYIEKLANYDLVILEPRQILNDQVNSLQRYSAKKPLIFGYLSVMETPNWNTSRMDLLRPEDFYYSKVGTRTIFSQWNSYLMDLRIEHYRRLLLEEINYEISAKQLDGVFLDTVDDLELSTLENETQHQMKAAYGDFLKECKQRFPQLHFIQNRGFDELNTIGSCLYGVLWEDWNGNLLRNPWVKHQLERLYRLQKSGMLIFSVSQDGKKIHKKTAQRLGFIHLTAPNGYNTLNF